MVWNGARVSCLQRDWQFRFEGVIVLFHTFNEQFVSPQGDKLRQFSGCKIFPRRGRREEDDDSYLRLGYSIILYIIFHIFTIFIDIFKNSKLRISRNPCIEP